MGSGAGAGSMMTSAAMAGADAMVASIRPAAIFFNMMCPFRANLFPSDNAAAQEAEYFPDESL